MTLNIDGFSETVKEVLRKRPLFGLSLTRGGTCDAQQAAELERVGAARLFPGARAPDAALSGLLLLLGCWDRGHEVSQDVSSRDGDYWHAIAHRMEPDAANAGYWFGQVGEHPVFPGLRDRAAEILSQGGAPGWQLKPAWDPFLFTKWCDEARPHAGTEKERLAVAIQAAEWELLFEWCALRA